jgi:hypothetical protein
MKLQQNKKVKLIGITIKSIGALGLLSLCGFLIYQLSIAENEAKQRAILYQQEKDQNKFKKYPNIFI